LAARYQVRRISWHSGGAFLTFIIIVRAGGDWVKLRDDVEQVLCEFQDNFAKARFIVVMNEASILPAEVHLLDPTQVRVCATAHAHAHAPPHTQA
jgi:hypothetical protein